MGPRSPRPRSRPHAADGGTPSVLPRVAALVVALFAFLPIVDWIPGGRSAPWYPTVAGGWVSGTAIALGVGVVLAILSRRVPALWRDGAVGGWMARLRPFTTSRLAAIAAAAFLVYAVVAWHVFDARPLLIDEIVQVIQAQVYATGRLWTPPAAHPEFHSIIHTIDFGGKVYSQFPPGGPAMFVPGVLLGAPWLVVPLCGAVAVLAFAALARRVEPRESVAFGALLLFAFAPFMAFMAGSHMNHVPTLMWVVIAVAALAATVASEQPAPRAAALCGFGLGAAATIRPLDAFAFAVPAAAWLLWRTWRDRSRWRDLVAAGVGVAVPVALMMWVNVRTTGAPLRFGYEVLWGKSHALGFHRAPWGMSHTPERGLELVSLYLLRLQSYFLETPFPSLLPAVGALLLARRASPLDRYLLASGGLLVALYFAYWHDGFFLGPRFVFLLLPALALWTARLPGAVRDALGNGVAHRVTVYGLAVGALIAAAVSVPLRARQYAGGLVTMRWNADSAAAAAGARGALVLVRESWGAQVVVRMWALGVPRPEAELIYRGTDLCALESAVDSLERGGVRGEQATRALLPLLADSARVIASPVSADTTERLLPHARYTPRCLQRLAADREGFTLLPPLLLSRRGGNVFVRDLHERDTLLLREYPERPIFLLRPESAAEGAPPRFFPLSRDSLLRAWRPGGERATLAAGRGPAAGPLVQTPRAGASY